MKHFNHNNYLQISYKADSNQIGFLQLLSTSASQNLTYHCKHSIGYFDVVSKTFKKGLKLHGWNDADITARGNQKLRYTAIEDQCKVCVPIEFKDKLFVLIIKIFFHRLEVMNGVKQQFRTPLIVHLVCQLLIFFFVILLKMDKVSVYIWVQYVLCEKNWKL